MVNHLSDEQKQEFVEAFDLYDRDYSGTISKKELHAVLLTLGQHKTEEGELLSYELLSKHNYTTFLSDNPKINTLLDKLGYNDLDV